ncbi:hypothetical protein GGH92_006525 [Coemansia sp. RSA 2673]|nr:hypothetical protein GGH92_006525 [Coemansia sp. RSA 2673]
MHTHMLGGYARLVVLEASASNFVLALGEHVQIRATFSDGVRITRPYTPVMIEAPDGIVRPHLFVRLYGEDHRMSDLLTALFHSRVSEEPDRHSVAVLCGWERSFLSSSSASALGSMLVARISEMVTDGSEMAADRSEVPDDGAPCGLSDQACASSCCSRTGTTHPLFFDHLS